MDAETRKLLIQILEIQDQMAAWTKDALVRTCALRTALAAEDSTLGERYRDALDHCTRMDDSELVGRSLEQIQALLRLLKDEDAPTVIQ